MSQQHISALENSLIINITSQDSSSSASEDLLLFLNGMVHDLSDIDTKKDKKITLTDNDSTNEIRSAVYSALDYNLNSFIKILLQTNILNKDNIGLPLNIDLLNWAIKKNHMDLFLMILNNSTDLNAVDNLGQTALNCAVIFDNQSAVKMLLNKGANVNSINTRKESALMHSMSHTHATDIASILIENGADINLFTNTDALYWAVKSDNYKMVQLLVDAGANLNSVDLVGNTALIQAIFRNNKEMVKLLVNSGIDITIKNMYGKNTLDYAENYPSILEILNDCKKDNSVPICIDANGQVYPSLDLCNIIKMIYQNEDKLTPLIATIETDKTMIMVRIKNRWEKIEACSLNQMKIQIPSEVDKKIEYHVVSVGMISSIDEYVKFPRNLVIRVNDEIKILGDVYRKPFEA